MCESAPLDVGDDARGEPVTEPGCRLGGTCCVVSDKPYNRVEGRYCTDGGFNAYIKVLSYIFDRIILAVPVSHGPSDRGVWPMERGIATFAELPVFPFRYPYELCLHPLAYGRPLRRAVREADLVHVIVPGYMQLLGLGMAQALGKPVFCSVVGDWEANFQIGRKILTHPRMVAQVIDAHRVILRWILKSGLIFTYGRELTAKYQRINPNVVNNQDSTFSEAQVRAPETLGPLGSPPRLLYVGRLDYKKGVTFLLEAQAALRSGGLPARLTIVGDGPDRGEFEACVQRLQLAELVEFAGYVPQGERLRAMYREHDVFVLPSLTEGAPKVVVEAYAAGLPVISTNAGGIPGMVSPDNGILVPPSDAAALEHALRRVLLDNSLRLRLARNNIALARTQTMEAQARHMAAHLKRGFPRLFKSA